VKDRFDNISIQAIEVEGSSGSTVTRAIEDCITLAATRRTDVKLKFNEDTYFIKVKDVDILVDEIMQNGVMAQKGN